MTNRERAMNILHGKEADRMPAVHFGYWPELLYEWAEQGKIPLELAQNWYDGGPADEEIDRRIGWDFNWSRTVGANNGLMPPFEHKVLEVLPDGTQRVQNGDGLIEKILSAIVCEMRRKVLSKAARTRGHSVAFFSDPFKLIPVSDLAEIADKFTRNEIMSANEIRQIIGMKPSSDPRADELRNSKD